MKIYDIENKVKSTKWNAFLLKQDEVEEYLADGIPPPNNGLFSRFSKAKKENDDRRNKRMVDLLSPRMCILSEEYFRHNILKPDKEIVSMVIEPTKNMLMGRSVSSIFKGTPKDGDPISIKLQELISEGKSESGDVVAFYPVFIGIEKGVFFITTKGICFISVNEGNASTIAPYAVANALGGFGAIAVGVVTIASKYIAHSVEDYKMDKEQRTIIELSDKYSPCLIARCFENSQFIPFNVINALIYGGKSRENKLPIICLYQNIQKRVIFEVDQDVMIKIVENLSKDNPPEII